MGCRTSWWFKNAGSQADRPWKVENYLGYQPENRTNITGIFASGEVTGVTEKQILTAAGERAGIALSAYAWWVKNTPVL